MEAACQPPHSPPPNRLADPLAPRRRLAFAALALALPGCGGRAGGTVDGQAQAGAALHLLAHPGRLFADEFVQAHLAALHHVQRLFPDRRGTGVGDGAGDGVDQAAGGRGGGQGLALFDQVAALEQALDDAGAGRLGADAGGVLEFLLEARVVDQFGDVLHRLDQVALGEGFRRLGPEILEGYAGHAAVLAFAQGRQGLSGGRFAALGGCQGFGQGTPPAGLDYHLADRAQGLAGCELP